MRALNRQAGPRCRARVPEVFGASELARYRRALDRWDAMCAVWYREPMTLVHGDSHLGNFFEDGAQDGAENGGAESRGGILGGAPALDSTSGAAGRNAW